MKNGFTLAEVLITLAVVGIIAVLTLPRAFISYQKKVLSTQIQKTYSLISDATHQVMVDEMSSKGTNDDDEEDVMPELNADGTPVLNEDEETINEEDVKGQGFYGTSAGLKTSNSTQGAEYFLTNYFKSDSKGSNISKYMAANYKDKYENNIGTLPNGYFCIETSNAASICMKYEEAENRQVIIIDTNGSEKPNKVGRDLFGVTINASGSLEDIDSNATCGNVNNGDFYKKTAGCIKETINNNWKVAD